MKKSLLLSLVLIINLNATEIYTIDELTIKALEISPNIHISASQIEASLLREDIAFSGYLPTFDASLSGGEVGITNYSSNKIVNDSVLIGQLSLKQLVYDFGKISGNYDVSTYDTIDYSHQHQQNISNIKRDVKIAYYEILQSIALIKVNKEDIKLNEQQLHRAQEYFKAGIKTKIDISDAKVQLIQSKLDLRKNEYNLKLAYASMDEIIGFLDIENNYEVYSPDLDINNLYATLSTYPLNLKEAINYAYENKQEIKSFQTNVSRSQASKTLANSEYYPSIYASTDYTKQEAGKLQTSMPEEQYQLLINLNWNIYSGGSSDALNQEKQIQENIASLELQNIKLASKQFTTEAYLNVYKMKDSVELSQSLLEVSKEKFTQAQKRYEHGLSDYIELQESRQGYVDSMASLVLDYYNYYRAVAILDNAIGR